MQCAVDYANRNCIIFERVHSCWPMNSPSLGQKLLEWRTRRGYTQEDIGRLLRGVTAPTVGRWEKGQEIPGPVQICLECLVDGKVPFQDVLEGSPVKEAMWKLQMSLEAWERLEALRLEGGFATVTDFIAALIQEELGQPADTRTSDHGAVDEMALVSEGGDAVGGHLDAAASAFAKENPLPAGEAGGTAGTTGARKDVRYTRPPGRSGTGAGKR